MIEEKVLKFLSEIEMLKRVDHEGFRLSGVSKPHSVASHAAIASQIAYILAKLEKADALKCALIVLFHDNEETRIGDHHKVASRYIDMPELEQRTEKDLYSSLGEIGKEILSLQEEIRERNTKEGIIAKDADWLETALQAKIYSEIGYKGCEDMLNNVEKLLETESAKEILKAIRENNDFVNYWWRGLKKMDYKKLEEQS